MRSVNVARKRERSPRALCEIMLRPPYSTHAHTHARTRTHVHVYAYTHTQKHTGERTSTRAHCRLLSCWCLVLCALETDIICAQRIVCENICMYVCVCVFARWDWTGCLQRSRFTWPPCWQGRSKSICKGPFMFHDTCKCLIL